MSERACPTCGSTDLEKGEFDPTHPIDIEETPDDVTRNRKCRECGEAFDWVAAVNVEVDEE